MHDEDDYYLVSVLVHVQYDFDQQMLQMIVEIQAQLG